MDILSVGAFSRISNTSLHRSWALNHWADNFDQIDMDAPTFSLWHRVAYHLFLYGMKVRVPDEAGANERIVNYVGSRHYDVVWIDKGVTIMPETLQYIKKVSPDTKIVSYSPDNMALRHNQSQQYLECLPCYDVIFTNKSYILDDMRRLGAKRVVFIDNLYESSFHHPMKLTDKEKEDLGGDVGFIGAWEKDRANSILYLADHGIKVKVFGDKRWKRYKNVPNLSIYPSLFSEKYSKALQAFKISLCFLRKMNFDRQTSRTMEIPGCGGFMLAERTDEHLRLFTEGKEAEYFSSDEELLRKCKYYLSHDEERRKIAEAGHQRCITSGYSNIQGIKRMLDMI